MTGPSVHTFTEADVALIVDGLGGIDSGDCGSYSAETRAHARELAARLEAEAAE